MKLARENMKKAAAILAEIPYNPVKENCYIAVPIETDKVEEFGGIELTVVNKEQGIKRAPDPVLLMNYNGNTPVVLGYADTTYSRHFNLFDYCELLGCRLPRGAEILNDIDVLLVDKQNVLMSFEF